MSTATRSHWRVETWDPAYGVSTDEQPGQSRIEPTLDVELAAHAWRPVDPGPRAWPEVLFVDGVRRIDAMGWAGSPDGAAAGEPAAAADGPDGTPSLGLFASYAAGVVRCRPGHAELVDAQVHRGLFSGADPVDDVDTSAGRYAGIQVALRAESPPMQQLGEKVQERMRATELAMSQRARATCADTDLLVVDGPLHNQVRLPRTLGYAKTHATHYLPAELNRLVGRLAAGQRTPVFGLRDRYSWYLKLPGGSGAPWAGVVRVECWADLSVDSSIDTAIELASASQPTLCRYASSEYKDARAPQNLYPIAGLERELRRRLGDQRLLHRAVRRATAAGAA
ncbi:MAG: hypothetical protein ACT4O0_13970 [Pseudonocardia sp.]